MYFSRRYDDIENYIPSKAWEHAKQCALIAVDEILASKPNEVYKIYSTWIPASTYWIYVKEQIEKL
jgi:hypothetical protein